jgi:hypothetical protein
MPSYVNKADKCTRVHALDTLDTEHFLSLSHTHTHTHTHTYTHTHIHTHSRTAARHTHAHNTRTRTNTHRPAGTAPRRKPTCCFSAAQTLDVDP